MKWEPVTDQMKDYFNSFDDYSKEQVKRFAEKIFLDQRYDEMSHVKDCANDKNCENRFMCQMIELQFQQLFERQSERMSERYVNKMNFGNEIGKIKHKMLTEAAKRAPEFSEPGGMEYISALEEAARILKEAEDVLYKVS